MTRVEETLKAIEVAISSKTGASLPADRIATIPLGQLLMFLDQNDIQLTVGATELDFNTAMNRVLQEILPEDVKDVLGVDILVAATKKKSPVSDLCDQCALKKDCKISKSEAEEIVKNIPPPPPHILMMLRSLKEMEASLGFEIPTVVKAAIQKFCP